MYICIHIVLYCIDQCYRSYTTTTYITKKGMCLHVYPARTLCLLVVCTLCTRVHLLRIEYTYVYIESNFPTTTLSLSVNRVMQ